MVLERPVNPVELIKQPPLPEDSKRYFDICEFKDLNMVLKSVSSAEIFPAMSEDKPDTVLAKADTDSSKEQSAKNVEYDTTPNFENPVNIRFKSNIETNVDNEQSIPDIGYISSADSKTTSCDSEKHIVISEDDVSLPYIPEWIKNAM